MVLPVIVMARDPGADGHNVLRREPIGRSPAASLRQGAALSSAGGDSLRIRLLTLEGRRIADARREDAQRIHG
jgi:hypothetical protein